VAEPTATGWLAGGAVWLAGIEKMPVMTGCVLIVGACKVSGALQ
jgi:hypothetical protein